MQWAINKRNTGTSGFVIAVAIVAGIGAISYLNLFKYKENTQRVAHTLQVIERNEDLLSQIKDAETAQRGYILTGKEEYLEPYPTTTSEIEQKFQTLRQLTADNPNQQQRLNALEPLVTKKLTLVEQTINLRRNKGLEAALQIVQTDRGQQLMDDIRTLAAGIENEEKELLEQRSVKANASALQTTLLTVMGSVLASVIVGLAATTINKELAKRQQAESALQKSRDELEIQVKKRTAELVKVNSELQTEITERKRAEKALRESEERYRSLMLASTQISWTNNADGQMTGEQHSWSAFTGQTYEEYQNFGWSAAIHPDDLEDTLTSWNTAVSHQSLCKFEHRVRRHDGEFRYFSVRAAPVLNVDGSVREWVGAHTDITERKQAEFEILQLNTQLEQRVAARTAQLEAANKELEAFSYSVSHDLRSPLRSIDGFSQALLEDYTDKLDALGQNYLQRVRAATQRMAQLIDDLLNLSRVTRSEMRYELVELSELAQAIATELQQTQPERQVEFVIAPNLVTNGDARLLRIVLENLLGNAWKFTGKHLYAQIEFGFKHDDKLAYFVRDDGTGFDMTYANKLFGAFQRLHAMTEFEGTGIGLATVQRIIHRHGGRVWAEGVVEQGATFYFTLTEAICTTK